MVWLFIIAPGDVDGGDLTVVKEQFLEALFAPFKLNFSPFQGQSSSWSLASNPRGPKKHMLEKVEKKRGGGCTWKESVSPVLPNNLNVGSNGSL